jgi:hypothetical protein
LAKLTFNPDKSLVEIETPSGEVLDPIEVSFDEDGNLDPIFLVDEENPDAPAFVAIAGEYAGLKTNTIYQLIPVLTEVEEGVDLEADDEEDDEDEDA